MYAVLDIETTGGKFNEEGITEIAIYRFDGHEIVDQFISLVNPERPIQPFVVKLTGISNKMLRRAPRFWELAKRIIEITEGCTLIAHNAEFDYRMLRLEFDRLGYDFKRNTLCTVELSKKLIPDREKYSLGILCRSLGIPVSDRHRANGDALATVELFKVLLEKDVEKKILQSTVQINKTKRKTLEPKLLDILDGLPTITGVYYIHNQQGDIVYVGKSKNIKKRVNQHFINTSSRSKKMQQEVGAVTYEDTGSELIALLKESEEIKKLQPIYNRAQRRTLFSLGLFEFEDENGYRNLEIRKIKKGEEPYTSFASMNEAKSALFRFVEEHHLCQKLCGLYKSSGACFAYGIEECNGACVNAEAPDLYNMRIEELLRNLSYERERMLIIDKGRHTGEKSVVLIEEGVYKGYAYVGLNHQLENPSILRNLITPMNNNRDVKNIIQSFIRRNKIERIIKL